ncbi:MAG: hypothetical protein ACKOPQ_09785 [Novosphingobium sp.]
MNRTVLGAFAALLMVAAGTFWWQGRAALEVGDPPPRLADMPTEEGLPDETGAGMKGALPPAASEASKEQRRFDRLDRNRDGKITRTEMLTPRIAGFRKLDKDGNNLLSFEEWAVKTSNRFAGADGNGDGNLDRAEFAKTKPKVRAKPGCNCGPPTRARATGARAAPEPAEDDDET